MCRPNKCVGRKEIIQEKINDQTQPIDRVSLAIWYIPIHIPNGIVNRKSFSFGALLSFTQPHT